MLGFLIKNERIQQNISQATLCDGICTVSYLSKIENENVVCNDEIYQLLFSALNITYIDEEEEIKVFKNKYEEYFSQLEHCADISLCNKMKYSSCCIEANLYLFMLMIDQSTVEDIKKIEWMSSYLNNETIPVYALVKSEYNYFHGNINDAMNVLMTPKLMNESWANWKIGQYHLFLGNYYASIEYAKEGYRLFANMGDIQGMVGDVESTSIL